MNLTKVGRARRPFSRFAFILTLAVVLAGISTHQVSAQKVGITIKNNGYMTVEDVFELIKSQTDYNFAYRSGAFQGLPMVTVQKGTISMEQLLQGSLYPHFDFTIDDGNRSIIVVPREGQQEDLGNRELAIFGSVEDDMGVPLMGVTVLVPERNRGTFSSELGTFLIEARVGDVIRLTYVGFGAKEYIVKDESPLNVTMFPATNKLDEVQVTAYGKTSQRLATGNVTTIRAKEIERNVTNNVLEAVQGKVPGVFITQASGQPGSAFNVQIRGRNTLNDATPLLIIDGVAMPLNNLPEIPQEFNTANFGGSALNYIDPNDIESINFLKDADATSIYGSRGSNGVILITMKKGRKGDPVLSLSTRNGVSVRGRSPQLLRTEDFLTYRREAIENAGLTIGEADIDVNGTYDPNRYTNFEKYFFGAPALTTDNSVSYSGGTDQVTFLISGNLNSETSIQNANGRNTMGGVNFNVSTNTLDRKFIVNLSGNYSHTNNNTVRFPLESLLMPPNSPAFYTPDGNLNWNGFDDFNYINPARVNNVLSENKVDNLTSNLTVQYVLARGLQLNANVGINILSSNQINALPKTFYTPTTTFNTNESTFNHYRIRTLTAEPNLTYEAGLDSWGNLTLQTGATLQDQLSLNNQIVGRDILSDANLRNPTFAEPENIGSNMFEVPNRYIGFFGIGNYNLGNTLILRGNLRYDGSTRFASGSRFGLFGSGSLAWVMSEHKWFKEGLPFVNFAKIRSSYGSSGGDGIGNYLYLTTYTQSFIYNNGISLRPSGPASSNLRWERNKKFELSLDFELWDGRIQISESFYQNISDDQLINFPTSIVTGVPTISRNSPAIIKNWGHEIAVNTINIQKDKFNWSTNFNITLPRNRLVSYPNSEVLFDEDLVVGQPITGVRLFDYQGVDPQTGTYQFWKDLNGNGEINDGEINEWNNGRLDFLRDRTAFINIDPQFYGGLSNNFTFGSFNLGIFMSYTKRNGLNFLGSQLSGIGQANISQEVFDARWQRPGDVTDVGRISLSPGAQENLANFRLGTGAYSDASFVRLENVNLSMDLPSQWAQRNRIKSARLLLQAQNIFTFSSYKGYDPETLGTGVAPLRTIVFGLEFSL